MCNLHYPPTSDVDPDPDSFGSVDPDSESGSGSRGIKSLIKWREKQSLTNNNIFVFAGNYIFQVWTKKSRCWCLLTLKDVLKILWFYWPGSGLDPDPNPDPHHCPQHSSLHLSEVEMTFFFSRLFGCVHRTLMRIQNRNKKVSIYKLPSLLTWAVSRRGPCRPPSLLTWAVSRRGPCRPPSLLTRAVSRRRPCRQPYYWPEPSPTGGHVDHLLRPTGVPHLTVVIGNLDNQSNNQSNIQLKNQPGNQLTIQ